MILDALLIQISTSYLHKEIRKNEPQLGQYYIAEYASQCGYNVKVKKYSTAKPILEDLIALTRDTHARIIGFYVDSENDEFTFIIGMTWEDFLDTDYNDGRFGYDEAMGVTYEGSPLCISDNNLSSVELTAPIEDGHMYAAAS